MEAALEFFYSSMNAKYPDVKIPVGVQALVDKAVKMAYEQGKKEKF